MALPLTEYPLVDIELYTTGEKVSFRPFLVKEEKLLVMAAETNDPVDMIRATQQVVTNCSFGKVRGDEIPIFEMQNIFINLRKTSVGSDIDVRFTCGHCDKKNDIVVDLNNFELHQNEDHQRLIKVSDTMSVEMSYPKADELKELAGAGEEDADIYTVSASCLNKIYIEDMTFEHDQTTQEERMEFIENMTGEQFNKIRRFFETMPVLENKIEFTCQSCGKENVAFMNGYMDFFA